jgi:alkylation response protein AidB-like acyl-CoA dehydrogenase
MDLSFTPEQERYRRMVREWLAANMPEHPEEQDTDRAGWLEPAKAWQRKVLAAGYLAVAWPRQYGGQGLAPVYQVIVNEEMARAGAPRLAGEEGLLTLGPTLLACGSEEQKRRYIAGIISADTIWTQGYSEPEAGSDLASLSTRAELDGDHFVVNGRKLWASHAQIADRMFALVRTDPSRPKHQGSSYLLIDLRAAGITVRQLVQIDGKRDFSEVTFRDVRVDQADLVGGLNHGWKVANSTLANERGNMGLNAGPLTAFAQLLETARRVKRQGRALIEHPYFRHRIAEIQIQLEALRLHSYRQLTNSIRGRTPGVDSMVTKLAGSEIAYALAAAAMEMCGDYAMLERDQRDLLQRGEWARHLMTSIAFQIAGGTSQIQKNIIAQRGLGMPRERSDGRQRSEP